MITRAGIVNACAFGPHLAQRLASSRTPSWESLDGLVQSMDRAGVSQTLVVLEEISEEFQAVQGRTGRLQALAYYDSEDPVRGLSAVQAMVESVPAGVLGIAAAFSWYGQDPRLNAFGPLYAYCLERRLPIVIGSPDSSRQADNYAMACGVLASLYPGMRVICLEPASNLDPPVRSFPRLPNLFVAAAGDRPGLALAELVRAVGSRQIMFATGTAPVTPAQVSAIRGLPFQHRNNVAWRTAGRAYGLPLG